MTSSAENVDVLRNYTACDVSDALLKLKVPGAGFVPDLTMYAAPDAGTGSKAVIAPASTVLFAPKDLTAASPESQRYPQPNIPEGAHWADLTQPGTIVIIKQPDGLKNAVCGGIMALRMKVCQAQGIVVCGFARDLDELKSTELSIWAAGLSTVGAGAVCTPWAIQVPITVDGGTTINPGDLVFGDPVNGVVVIPKDKIADVVNLLPGLTEADEKVKSDVLKGMTVRQAFRRHRGNL